MALSAVGTLPGPARLRVIGAITTRFGSSSGPRRTAEKTSTLLISAPHLARRLENTFELAPLVLLRNRNTIEAAKAALRAQRQLLGRQIFGRLVDTPPQQIKTLQIGPLGGDEAAHHDLLLR